VLDAAARSRSRHAGRRRVLRGRGERARESTRCSSGWRRSAPRRSTAATSCRRAAARSSTPPPSSRAPAPRSSCAAVATSSTITACTRRAHRSPTIPSDPRSSCGPTCLSCPEPGRAIAGVGRRDAPYDAGLPTVLRAYRGGEPLALDGAVITELNDQHAFVTADGPAPRRPPLPRHLAPVRRLRPLAHAARGRPGLHRDARDPDFF
jgi:D-serine deaminase-like pyridoxal phosphate-dependent protein